MSSTASALEPHVFSMRAVVYRRFGGPEVLALEHVPPPSPAPGEVLVAVEAAGLNPKDVLVRKGKFAALSGTHFPRIPGYDFAGRVLSCPPDAGCAPGDDVYGMVQDWRGGTCAELVCVPFDQLAPRPSSLSAVEAAAAPLAALTALQGLRDQLRVRPGDRVLIHGASGGVGSFAVQVARLLGARVVATCSPRNADRMRSLGAHEVIDYHRQDPCETGPYDAFFDVFGNRPFARARAALRPRHGTYCTTVPRATSVAWETLARGGLQRRRRLVIVESRRADLEVLSRWFERGHLTSPVDRVVPMEPPAAPHAYLETKRARGKVVVDIAVGDGQGDKHDDAP